MLLSELAEIRSGYTTRGKLEPAKGGGALIIQLGDVNAVSLSLNDNLLSYDIPGNIDHYLLRRGDILFRSRGAATVAVVLDDTPAEPTLAVNPLVVIRPRAERVLPHYLAWAINHPHAQRQLAQGAHGTSVRMVSVQALGALEIPTPNLATQRLIADTWEQLRVEFALAHSLLAARELHMALTLRDRALANESHTTGTHP